VIFKFSFIAAMTEILKESFIFKIIEHNPRKTKRLTKRQMTKRARTKLSQRKE